MSPIVIKRDGRTLKISTVGVDRGGSGWIFAADAVGTGGAIVSGKVYQDAGNNVLQSFDIAGGTGLTLTVRSSYPVILVDGVETDLPAAGDAFEGSVAAVAVSGEDLELAARTPNGGTGARHSLGVTVL